MKKLLRNLTYEALALYMISQATTGLLFENKFEAFLITSFALAAAMMLVKPIINILILPLTLATLGLFRFIAHAITLYVVDLAVKEFSVTSFNFPGLHSSYLDLPAISYAQGPLAYIAFSILLSTLVHLLHWLTR